MIDSRLIAFAGLALVLVLTPGANIMLVIRSTLARGPRAGVASALGIALGHFVHASASALGLSLLLRTSDAAFTAMKVLGAAYLAYLGVRSFVAAWRGRSRTFDAVEGEESHASSDPAPPRPSRRFLLDGFLCNVLNPKVALFYLALFPQFVDPARGSVLLQSLFLGAVQIGVAVVGDLMFVLAAAQVARWLADRPLWAAAQRWVLGGVFAAIAAKLALDTRR